MPMPPSAEQAPLLHFQMPQVDIEGILSRDDLARRQAIGDIVYNAIFSVVQERFTNIPPGLDAHLISCKITAIVIDAKDLDFHALLTNQSYFDNKLTRAFHFTSHNMMLGMSQPQPMPGQ